MKPESKSFIPKENVIIPPTIGWGIEDVAPLFLNFPESSSREHVLEILSRKLLGLSLEEMAIQANQILRPYSSNGEHRSTLIISSASSASGALQTERGILSDHNFSIDMPGAIEGRETRSAKPGDTAIISTPAGLDMASDLKNVNIIDLANEPIIGHLRGASIYYKADSLLLLMATNPNSETLKKIVKEVKKNPIIQPYNLDIENQIVLLWLTKKAGLDKLSVNANSPEVGVELTQKGYKYPTPNQALKLKHLKDPYLMQTAEWELSQAAREINFHPDYIPGYFIKHSDSKRNDLLISLILLSTRYDMTDAWIKPNQGTDGGNQGEVLFGKILPETKENLIQLINQGQVEPALNLFKKSLDPENNVEKWMDIFSKSNESWVVEVKTYPFTLRLNLNGIEKDLVTNPSVHIIGGQVRKNTISLQVLDGTAWGGNLICNQETWITLVNQFLESDPRVKTNPNLKDQLLNAHPHMTAVMNNYAQAINKSDRYRNGQVRGGVDLSICTLGGKFAHQKVHIAFQDNNARANGSETAYALYDLAQEVYGQSGQAITRNNTPLVSFSIMQSTLSKVIESVNNQHNLNIEIGRIKIIATSAGWSQIGVVGTGAMQITKEILLIEKEMATLGLIKS